MAYRLDADSIALLASITVAVVIGVLDPQDRLIRLFEASPATDVANRRFSGHQDLLRYGVVTKRQAVLGFSLQIVARQVHVFLRTSILNEAHDDFAIPAAAMAGIMDALGLSPAPEFRSYP
jgi:hypothetical protein